MANVGDLYGRVPTREEALVFLRAKEGYLIKLNCSGSNWTGEVQAAGQRAFKDQDNLASMEAFKLSELNTKGALALPGDFIGEPTSNLDNEILPLFAQNHWGDITDNEFDAFKPALQLASLWLTHWSCSSYWHTLITSEVRGTDPEKPGIVMFGDYVSFYYEKNEVLWLKGLLGVVDHVKFDWFTNREIQGDGDNRFTEPMTHLEYLRGRDKKPLFKIRLPRRIKEAAGEIANLSASEKLSRASRVLRFNFLVAKLICHQLAHVMTYQQSLKPQSGLPPPALPEMSKEGFACLTNQLEPGAHFEHALFGAVVAPISGSPDAEHGFCEYMHQNVIGAAQAMDAAKNNRDMETPTGWWTRYHSVPMTWIWKMQQKDTYPARKTHETEERYGDALKEFFVPISNRDKCAKTEYKWVQQGIVRKEAFALPFIPYAAKENEA